MYYFVSDTHFGIHGDITSHDREKIFVKWLDDISSDAKALFLVGDIFDFWFEFRKVVPKGFTRVLGKLAELSDRGIQIHFFTGNHDMWTRDYFKKECGIKVHQKGEVFDLFGKKVFVAHGDNLYVKRRFWENIMQRVFRSRFLQWVFRNLLHPDWVMSMGNHWSEKSRKAHVKTHVFCGEREYLVQFAHEYQKALHELPINYYVFGHIHCAHIYQLPDQLGHVAFLGEWLYKPSYAVLGPDGIMEIRNYPDNQKIH